MELGQLVREITPDTLIWTPGMQNWQAANTVPEVADLLRQNANSQQNAEIWNGGTYNGNNWEQPANIPPCPDTYLVWAILSFVLCCWPLGIVAIVYAVKVKSLWSRGSYEDAARASRQARLFTILSAVLGAIIVVVIAVISMVANSTMGL